jgi:hypothetical protein
MQPQFLGDESRLIVTTVPAFDAEYFLKRHNISINILKDVHNPPRMDTLVHSATLADVIGDYSQNAGFWSHRRTACCRNYRLS